MKRDRRNKTKTVFMVAAGGHDDYGPEALFTRRRAAERFRKFYRENAERFQRTGRIAIETWELDPPKWRWVRWIVRFNSDKSVGEVDKSVDASTGGRTGGYEKPFKDSEQHLCVELNAKNRKDAVSRARRIVGF